MSTIEGTDIICGPSQYSLLRGANSSGLPALADELLLEILSHFPSDPITTSLASLRQIIRRDTLLSLSAVCQNLRRIFRPYLWQRVEVYAGMKVGGHTLRHSTRPSKHFAMELLRQLNVVTTQDPALAQYVRYVRRKPATPSFS